MGVWQALGFEFGHRALLPDQRQGLVGDLIRKEKTRLSQLFNHGTGMAQGTDLLRQDDQSERSAHSDLQCLGAPTGVAVIENNLAVRIA